MEQEIVINLIGTGYDINLGLFPSEILKKLKSNNAGNTEDFHQLFELDFYRKNRFPKNASGELFYSWKDINGDNNFTGPNFCERSQLEIWINGKRKKTLKFADLYNDNLLFPLYSISEENVGNSKGEEKQLIIGHQLKGLIAKFSFKTKYFNMDQLQLSFLSFQHLESQFKILCALTYKDSLLKVALSDAVVTGIIIKLI